MSYDVFVQSQIGPNDTVRVTIVVEDGYNKQDVIDAVSEAMKDEPTFKVHNSMVAENVFSVNVKASALETIQSVEGVKEAAVSKKVEITDETTDSFLELEKQEETVTNEATPFYILGGIIFVAVLFLGIKKYLKR